MVIPPPPAALQGRQRLFALVFLAISAVLLITLWTTGTTQLIMVAAVLLALLWITRAVWTPDGAGRTRVRLASLTVVMGTATLVIGAKQWFEPLFLELIKTVLGEYYNGPIRTVSEGDGNLSIIVLMFVAVAVISINYFMRDPSAMQVHPVPLDIEFPEKQYRERLMQFCAVLQNNLQALNLQTSWSEAYFINLEAKVEVRSRRNLMQRKIMDLLSAIKSNRKSRIFLLLGDPGAGKSVALRMLATQLLDEVNSTGRVPIYVNLKEWKNTHKWSKSNPPTVEDLYNFIFSNLRGRSDVFGQEFLEKYFRQMLDHGRFFLLLDSFDEIPAVLDVGESSWLIQQLSLVLSTFLAGAGSTRGVIASRLYRRPTLNLEDASTLEIRPFSELQIVDALRRSVSFRESTLRELFTTRTELVPIARNPFTAALIRIYTSERNGSLPLNQLELYESYVQGRLASSEEIMDEARISADQVIDGCIRIAWTLFSTSSHGLEAPISEIQKSLPDLPVRSIARVLSFARLGRVGEADRESFSFVHRRFNEYFVARNLINNPALIDIHSIPRDSRWRDALVLYCEVAPEENVREIALYCWQEISHGQSITERDHESSLRAIHALRFLSDAFRIRPEALAPIQNNLALYIEKQQSADSDLLSAKLALEAVGVLRNEQIEPLIIRAFSWNNAWISETALRACRHLPRLTTTLEKHVIHYLNSIPVPQLLRRRRELLFSLGLSDGFRNVRRSLRNRFVDIIIGLIALMVSLIIVPGITGSLLVLAGAIFVIFSIVPFPLPDQAHTATRFRKRWRLRYKIALEEDWSGEMRKIIGRFFAEVDSPYSAFWLSMFRFVNAFILALVIRIAMLPHSTELPVNDGAAQRARELLFPFGDSYVRSFTRETIIIFIVHLLLIIILLPLYDFFRLTSVLRSIPKKFIAPLLTGVIVSGVLMVMFYFLITRIEIVERLIVFAGVGVTFVIIANDFVKSTSAFIRDQRRFKNSLITHVDQTVERVQIERDLAGFQTEGFRLRYVQRLDLLRVVAVGEWLTKRVPNFNDESSTLLAQLEERWLGLDR